MQLQSLRQNAAFFAVVLAILLTASALVVGVAALLVRT
jgi:hypothetical protein